MTKKKKAPDYDAVIMNELISWDRYRTLGGSDPFWPDGTNMNLLRNHIIYYKAQIEEALTPDQYPQAYYCELPPEMPDDFIACPEKIRADAKAALGQYLVNEDYLFLLDMAERLAPKKAQKLSVLNVIGHVRGLEMAIQDDDLVAMRRHRHPFLYISRFEICAEKIREILLEHKTEIMPTEHQNETEQQLDLFNFIF